MLASHVFSRFPSDLSLKYPAMISAIVRAAPWQMDLVITEVVLVGVSCLCLRFTSDILTMNVAVSDCLQNCMCSPLDEVCHVA